MPHRVQHNGTLRVARKAIVAVIGSTIVVVEIPNIRGIGTPVLLR